MKKGFTLVELLAVIIILAIISLITYAVVQKNIDVTKRSSFETSVKNIIEAAKEYVVTNYENNDFPEGGIDITNDELDIKNSEFKFGVIQKDENGQIIVVNLTDGNFCANGPKNNLVIEDGACDDIKDTTPPTLEVKVLKKTSSKVRFLVKMQDAQSGLKELSYCYGECEKQSTITFDDNERSMVKKVIEVDNLEAGKQYDFTFEVTNNVASDNLEITTKTETKTIELLPVEEPLFNISSNSYATTKHIKIIYPETDDYEYSYQIGNEEIIILEKGKYEAEFDVSENTKIKAIISKDENEIVSSE